MIEFNEIPQFIVKPHQVIPAIIAQVIGMFIKLEKFETEEKHQTEEQECKADHGIHDDRPDPALQKP